MANCCPRIRHYYRSRFGDLFNGWGATSETICYIVFPSSSPRKGSAVVEPDKMEPTVRRILHDLQKYDNTDELPQRLAKNTAESDMIRMVLTRLGAFPLQPPGSSN